MTFIKEVMGIQLKTWTYYPAPIIDALYIQSPQVHVCITKLEHPLSPSTITQAYLITLPINLSI